MKLTHHQVENCSALSVFERHGAVRCLNQQDFAEQGVGISEKGHYEDGLVQSDEEKGRGSVVLA